MAISQKLFAHAAKPLTISLGSLLLSTVLSTSAYAEDLWGVSEPANSDTPVTIAAADTTNAATVNPAPTVATPAPKGPTDTTTTSTTTTKQTQVTANATEMDQANMSDSDVLKWASDAAQLAYTYDFKNYPKQLQVLQDYFTPAGWKAFSNALNKSNNLSVVQSRKLVASANPTGKATLLKEGVKDGIYTWKIQIPMLATYESETRLIKQNLIVTLLVTRANTPKGVGISHFVAVVVPANNPPVDQTTAPAQDATGTGAVTTPPTTIYNQPATGSSGAASSPTTSGVTTQPSTTGTTGTSVPTTTGTGTTGTVTNPGTGTVITPGATGTTGTNSGVTGPGTTGSTTGTTNSGVTGSTGVTAPSNMGTPGAAGTPPSVTAPGTSIYTSPATNPAGTGVGSGVGAGSTGVGGQQ